MAERRMMAKGIIDTDMFMTMPTDAQCLYFHLLLRADDDGFIANPKMIMKTIGSNEDNLSILIAKGFVIGFASGVIVIKHWRIHNCIQNDRYHKTLCKEKQYLSMEKGIYEISESTDSISGNDPLDPKCIQNGSKMDPQVRLGKVRLGKVNTPLTPLEQGGTCANLQNGFNEFWNKYPRKVAKGNALKAYNARLKDGWSPEELMTALNGYVAEIEKSRTARKYIKHASTFLSSATPFTDYLKTEPKTIDPINLIEF